MLNKLLFLLLFTTASFGTVNVYYVGPKGNCSDSHNGTSPATAWCSIAHSLTQGSTGTQVRVLPGIYAGPITTSTSGASSARIRYLSSDSSGNLKLYGAMIRCASGVSCNQVWTQNGGYVDVVGFEITSVNTASQEGFFWAGAHGLIQQNKVHDIGCVGCASNGGAGINTRPGADYPTIDSNEVYNIGLHTGYNTVHGIYVNSSKYATVSNNLVFNVEISGIHFYHGTTFYAAKVVNNTVIHAGNGIMIDGNSSSYIANNILAHIDMYVPGYGPKPAIEEWGLLTGSTNIYTHNLFYQNSNADFSRYGGSAAVNSNPIIGNPLFVKYTGDQNGDYHLCYAPGTPAACTSGPSPAIDAATTTSAPNHDFYGLKRPQLYPSGAYDIGASESAQ